MFTTLLFLAATQSWTPLIQIGRVDHNTADLEYGPSGYARFATDPVYVVGRSDARRDWPYVIPGPADSWANGREHAFQIRFALASVPSEGAMRVRTSFAETHPASPPRLRLTVNGTRVAEWDAPQGHGDEGLMGKPETGKTSEWTVDVPRSALRTGANQIEIRSVSGSWAAFDAVTVEGHGLSVGELPPAVEVEAMRPGQTLIDTPKGPGRDLSLHLVNTGPATQGTVSASGTSQTVSLPTGATDLRLSCVVPNRAMSLPIGLRTTSGLVSQTTVALQPVRPWKIFLFPEGHVDIGYTHPQSVVAEIQTQNLRDAMGLIDETRRRPEGERYRWNAETAWGVENYLAVSNAAGKERLRKAVAAGELGVSVAYANMLYGLCRPEEMLRTFTVPSVPRTSWQTASLSDVPGVPWGLVTALHQAGVQNLVYWPNAGDVMRGRIENRPFWWLGRDGESRVFFWPMVPYSLGTDIKGVLHMAGTWYPGRPHAVRTQTPEEHFLGDWLPSHLDSIASWYPYDIVGVPWSISDNGAIDLDVPEAVRLWNRRYASPKIEIVSIDEGCRKFLARYGRRLPTIEGDFGPQWEDGAASSASETSMNRRASERLAQAEVAWSLIAPRQFPRERFDRAWKNVLLYSEHTWGAADSWSNPDGENQRRQWAVKSGFAHDGATESRKLMREAVRVQSGNRFTVLNSSIRPRSGLVEVDGAGLVWDEEGHRLPSQVIAGRRTAFVAQNVPPLGARRYRLVPGNGTQPERSGNTIDNGTYRVEADPKTGAITISKNGTLLTGQGFGQYLYLRGSDPSKFTGLRDVTIAKDDDGPLVWSLRISGHGDGATGAIVRRVRLVKGLDSVEIALSLEKAKVRDKEIAFLSMPFALEHPTVHFQGPWAPFDPARDLVKGANDQFFTIDRWVQLQGATDGVTVVSLDTPVLVHGRPSAARLGDGQPYDPHSPNIQFQLVQNHWDTNYLASQSGRLDLRYVLRGDRSYDPGSSARFAEDFVRPLIVGSAEPRLPFAVRGDVELSALRPARRGGWIVRVFGSSGRAATVDIVGRKIAVYASDARETRGARVTGAVKVPAYGVRSFLVTD